MCQSVVCSKVWSINIKYKSYFSLSVFCFMLTIHCLPIQKKKTIHCPNNVGFFHSCFSSLAANFAHFAVSRLCGSQQLHNWLGQALPNHAGSSNSCFHQFQKSSWLFFILFHSPFNVIHPQLCFLPSPNWLPIFTKLHEVVMSPKG